MTSPQLTMLIADFERRASVARAQQSSTYFKTGTGEYGEGDVFIGITVPEQRIVAKQHASLPLKDIGVLLSGKIHEHRSTALMILELQYRKADAAQKQVIVEFYKKQFPYINNWDLVDGSAPYILGDFLLDKDNSFLDTLALSKNIWERRIAIVATYAFIKKGTLDVTLRIAKNLLDDKHDLVHKATGWMLREVGKKDVTVLRKFLDEHVNEMPRTTLRYAIERFDKKERADYLSR